MSTSPPLLVQLGTGSRPLSDAACYAVVLALGLLIVGVALFVPAYPQPQRYHLFADGRALFGIPNFGNVASNAAFLAVGVWGLGFLFSARGRTAFLGSRGRGPYAVFFAGAVLTALGSSLYHWAPSDATLTWDRVGMAVAFSALVPAVLADRTDSKAIGPALLIALLLGVGSVVYWRATAALGVENVLPYLVLQAAALATVLGLNALPSRYTRRKDLYGAFLWYAAALAAENLDRQIYALGEVVSGHSLKHLLAAAAMGWILRMLMKRRPTARDDAAGGQPDGAARFLLRRIG
ncbi:alkaline phytoceramidase [Pelomicrobium methylotrophicum]|uniref:Alkaline phytoceramidase n=1 Tax=Pelomicrobium methylotrophicum TaxID=2602750 RepID=A0A5C7EWQ5_9PROT|nr:alkaline phytoceramidase [Pelomicrobium methylotrophicum]TXF12830.1 alkaline phytoceramidase [Pelomicrobium methylotrophicum]